MRGRVLYISIALLAITQQVFAQKNAPVVAGDTAIRSNTIEIIQSYKPEVKQHPKPEISPVLPPTDTSHPAFTYDVPQQTLYYTYTSLPLRPLALGQDSAHKIYPNYVKLGGGNLSTLYLDAGISSLRGQNYETAIHLHSISQKGNIQYQQSSLSDLDAEGTLHVNDKAWHASIGALRNQYNYYGYNHDLYQYGKDSVRQTFTGVKLGVDMQREHTGINELYYHPVITASVYSDKFNASETSIGVSLPFAYSFDTSLEVSAAINANVTQLSVNSGSSSNNILQLAPGLRYHREAFAFHAYIDPTVGKDKTYLLPDIEASYRLLPSLLTISAGWQALLNQNTYQELSTENPYIFNNYVVRQTHSNEVFADVKSNIGNHFTVAGRFNWWQYDALPVFVNGDYSRKQFNVLYDENLNATSLQLTIRYQVGNTFSVGLNSIWYSFSNGNQDHPWEIPAIRVKGDLLFKPIPTLAIGAYVAVLDGIYAVGTNGYGTKLNSILDIGGNVEYNFIPRLSGFVQITNLLNNKNERWMGYEAYGFNIYAGIRFKF
ncbi:MAG: hypothetical protein ACTHJ0_05990 [Flavipsychrobacter sp.]